jgi:hypothetical protein
MRRERNCLVFKKQQNPFSAPSASLRFDVLASSRETFPQHAYDYDPSPHFSHDHLPGAKRGRNLGSCQNTDGRDVAKSYNVLVVVLVLVLVLSR